MCADKRAPDATLRRFFGYGMKRAFTIVQTDLNAVLKPFGLRMITFSALVVIRDTPGLRQAQLARVLQIEKPNLVALLDELERAGLITRTRLSEDRRAHALDVTGAGITLAARAVTAVEAHEARMTEALSAEDRQALLRALRRIEDLGEQL